MRRRRFFVFPLIIAAVVMAFQYFGAEKFVNPETGEKARVALSTQDEAALGLQSYQQVLADSEVITAGPEFELVKRTAARLAQSTGAAGKDFQWEVALVRSDQVNAFCLPGGKIAVYTGILPVAKTEEGLAAVMGHEMAHAIARHGSQRLLQNSMAQTAMMGAQFSMADMDYRQRGTVMALLGAGAQYGVLMPFSRDHESEADQMGLIYMARAGYNPEEAVSFWERMAQEAGARNQPPEFMSTHPSHGRRVEQLKQYMPRALEEFKKAPQRQ
jgi:metalloendopeptidase OMA1, mitochondrial